MTLRRYDILLISILAVLAACSNDEPAGPPEPQVPREIAFTTGRTTTVVTSRTGDGDPLPVDNKMSVYSLYHHDPHDLFFYLKNQDFVYDSGKKQWCGSPDPVFYPLEGTMDFAAYAYGKSFITKDYINPVVECTKSGSGSATAYIDKLTLDYTAEGHQLDGSIDLTASSIATTSCSTTEPVNMAFKHLLCCVRINLITDNYETENTMRCTRAVLYDSYLTGKVTLTRSRSSDWSASWVKKKDVTSTTFTGLDLAPAYDEDAEVAKAKAEANGMYLEFYVLPQAISHQSYQMYIVYRKNNIDSPEMIYKDLEFGKPTQWEAGKRYIYTSKCRVMPNVEFRVELTYDGSIPIDDKILTDWESEEPVEL